MTRRSLFALMPMPLAGLPGLLTTSPEPTPTSDPVAVAALAYKDQAETDYQLAQAILILKEQGRSEAVDILMDEVLTPSRVKTAAAETALRERLAGSPGVSVVVNGQVYCAGRQRDNHIVRPVWVAMLRPTDGH